ncbi:hypothetical protein L2E82_52365 [Cichorium intybus]|nr:hypothetical protein L2E82_52365 [Cichorium intybus]
MNERLSSPIELTLPKAYAFANAKISKFIPNVHVNVYLDVQAQEKVIMPSEIKNYDNSPSAILPMVSREAYMDEHGKPQVEMHWAWELQWNLRKMIALLRQRKIVELETCGMMARIRLRYIGRLETRPIIELLHEIHTLFMRIERLITPLSASKRAVIQPHFLSLCEEAAILTNNMLGWVFRLLASTPPLGSPQIASTPPLGSPQIINPLSCLHKKDPEIAAKSNGPRYNPGPLRKSRKSSSGLLDCPWLIIACPVITVVCLLMTGSGKTYTMMGEISQEDGKLVDDCGITPRLFEYLFTRIKLVREDLKEGVYVENLTEYNVKTVDEVLKLLLQVAANRKVARTDLNSESSRSHSVFTSAFL